MNIVWGVLFVIAVCGATVTAMLLVRRSAPEGSYFSDGDRASGVFGVLATGFSVLLGFIIFLSFSSYDESRSGAETEATIVTQQVETAQFMDAGTAAQLTGQLMCYSRSVVGPEWDALAEGTLDSAINPWGAEMYLTLKSVAPQTAAEQSAYDRWMDQTTERQQARVSRIHGAEGIIPLPLWLTLFAISGVIFVYMLFFADRGERAKTQAMLMGSVTGVICMLLMLLVFFDHPHGDGVGRLQPTAMERTLRIMDAQIEVADVDVEVPCDGRGTQPEGENGGRLQPHEVLITILLIVGAVAASWSSYQATRWNGEQAKAAGRTSALRVEASTAANLASAQTQVDVATFIAWTDAEGSNEPELAEFYVDRFRPEFKTAFDAWLATDPFGDASAPKTPFAMDEYVVESGVEAARLGTEAEATSAVVARNIQRSSNYVLTVVLYTLVLLFAGMAAKMSSRRLRTGVIVGSFLLLLVALAWVSTFPVSVAV